MRGKTWRRLFVLMAACALARAQPAQTEITFDTIVQKARERAAKPFHPPQADLPEALRGDKLNYDSYREIRFRHDKALWIQDDLPFRLEFFHPGYLYQAPVKINEFNAKHAQLIRFVQDFFDYGKLNFQKRIPADAGYAGFRLLYRLNDPGRWDEVASFLGASYFRMLGKGLRYGCSARGLALNCGETDRAEEFPLFTDWWLGKPDKGVENLRFYGLLDSTNCAGAYEFLLRPGETTFAEVTAVVVMREGGDAIKTIGVAPLTSMFWFGENSERKPDDYRPEVHDSDGLLIRGEHDELTWRPLKNPGALEHQIIAMKNPRGFGLLQRDREFGDYQDIFNAYDKTPSVWVEPRDNWGEGEVHLVEIPTKSEAADNIVVFWSPKEKVQAHQELRFAYTLQWATQPDTKFAPCKVLQTRIGVDPGNAAKRQVVIDFSATAATPYSNDPPAANVKSSDNAAISDVQVFKNEVSKNWRVIFSLSPKARDGAIVDIECALNAGGNPVSETWRYQWSPSPQ
jgi:glucans biosynthesis protein